MSEPQVASARRPHVFVLPTYAVSQFENARRTAQLAADHGFMPVIVCNSATTAAAFADHPSALSPEMNTGYGGAANLVADIVTFETMVLCNDDLHFTDGAMQQLYAAVSELSDGNPATILGFLPQDRPRLIRLPGLLGVVALVSGLSAVSRRYWDKLTGRSYSLYRSSVGDKARSLPDPLGFPFVCVAITSEAWRGLGGFDARFPLYFEDMDLLARAHRSATMQVRVALGDCHHLHSASARTQMLYVLPLLSVGARNYLQLHLGLPRLGAALVVTAGLIIRALSRFPVRAHRTTELRAILRALKAAWSARPGPMPPWS